MRATKQAKGSRILNKKYNEYLREAERREEEEKERLAFLDMDFSKDSKDRVKKHNNGNYEADPAVGKGCLLAIVGVVLFDIAVNRFGLYGKYVLPPVIVALVAFGGYKLYKSKKR